MPKTNMKKLSILIIREELDAFLSELISLECVELTDVDDLPSNSELHAFVKREILDLIPYNANKESISALGTKYTINISGWVPSHCETGLIAILKRLTSAWELEDLSPNELDLAPVQLRCPWFFGKYRLAGRKLFSPLRPQIILTETDTDGAVNGETDIEDEDVYDK